MPQASHAFSSGPESLLNLIWSTEITGMGTISSLLDMRVMGNILPQRRNFTIEGAQYTLKDIMTRFLQGVGIPCQGEFDAAHEKGLFHPALSLRNIDQESFRPRMFSCAATGNAHARIDSSIYVSDPLHISHQ